MRYDYALNSIIRQAGILRTQQSLMSAIGSFRNRQLQATKANPKGWPWLAREEYRRNSGGYSSGTLAATQDSRGFTLSGSSFPDPCTGWRIVLVGSDQESYIVKTRTSALAVYADRPYEGETATGLSYKMFDPYIPLPNDLWFWQALVLEADSQRVWEVSRRDARQMWPTETPFGDGYYANIAKPTTVAGYDTGSVTVTKGSAAVTGSATSFPQWSAGHHFQIAGDNAMYKILEWGSATALTLDRPYGGYNAGAGKSYQIDPKGAMQVEISYPREKQYALRIVYMALPEEPVNDADLLLGDEAFLRAVIDMATADVLRMHGIDEDSMTPAMVQERIRHAQTLEGRGMSMLSGMIGSNAPQPDEDVAVQDIRYHGRAAHRYSVFS
jgi:hypothetical protein